MQATGPPPLSRHVLVERVLAAPRVRGAIATAAAAAASGGCGSEEDYERLARAITQRACTGVGAWLLGVLHMLLRWLLPLVFRAAYLDQAGEEQIETQHENSRECVLTFTHPGLAAIQRAALEKGCPIVYVPTVADSWQAVVVSFVCRARDLAAPARCCR